MAATEGIDGSPGFGRMPFAHSAATLPGVSLPSSVVRSMQRIARSSAQSFEDFLIERVVSRAARTSAPTWSTLRTPRIRDPRCESDRAVGTDHIVEARSEEPRRLFRSRSGALVGALAVSTLATGVVQIAVPLELRQLHASPAEIGVALSMFGFGMFAFEWVWGVLADRFGYRVPLIASAILYGLAIALLARAGSVAEIAIAYFASAGMMVAAGPLGRSFIGTTLPPRLRATGLALISAMWVFSSAIGSGAGGQAIERAPIASVLLAAAFLPLVSAVLLGFVFRRYRETRGIWRDEDQPKAAGAAGTADFVRVLAVTAVIVLLLEIG